jgi:dUTP pyrophosphatase
MKVKIQKISPLAKIPTYAKDGDAGMDVIATSIISDTPEQITYGLGIALEIPKGFVGLVFPRSSIRKTGLQLSNSVGVIDSGYRGELQATFNKVFGGEGMYDEMKVNSASLTNVNDWYKVGDRVAQIMIIPFPPIEFEQVTQLSETERGDGGFGSTGK